MSQENDQKKLEAAVAHLDQAIAAHKAVKLPKFKDAREAILSGLDSAGWDLKRDLKVPQATSPHGRIRLWFKPQAIWLTAIDKPWSEKHDFKYARSLTEDMRHYTNVATLVKAAIKQAARDTRFNIDDP